MFIVVGCGLLAGAIIFAAKTKSFLRDALNARGSIISMCSKMDDDSTSYAPVFLFTASDGQTYTVSSNKFSSPPEFFAGEKVAVIYEKNHPEQARIDTFYQVWGVEEVLGIIGGAFVAMGIGISKYRGWRDRRGAPRLESVP
jgi:hypothetical protein